MAKAKTRATKEYFLLLSEDDDRYCAIFSYPKGLPDIHKPSLGERMGASYPDGFRFRMSDQEKGIQIADVIANALGYLMVSSRMRDLLAEHSRVDIEFLRFTLLNHRGRVASSECYIANVLGVFDCVDMKRSDGDRKPHLPTEFFYLRRLVLREDRIPADARMFRTTAAPPVIVIRQDLKEILEKEGITGATYSPVGSDVSFTI